MERLDAPARPTRGARPFLLARDVKTILVLAVPAMLAFLTQTAVNIIDTWFFKHLAEPDRTDGQAMLSLALSLLWAIGGFISAISVGTQAMVARRIGSGDPRAAGAVLTNAAVLATAVSLVASIVGYLAIPHVFALASNDPEYVALGSAYTQWRFVGLVSMVVTQGYKAFFDGTGRTYVHLVASVLMNVVNIFFCWVLIFGRLGAPAMGVEGAGAAAAISSWTGLAVMLLFSLRRRDRVVHAPYRRGVLSRAMAWDLTRLSVPSGVATTVVMTGFILFRQIVQRLDTVHLSAGGTESIYGAATTIIIQILSLSFFACLAFGVATATLVSQRLGAADPEGAERYAWSSVKLGVILFGVVGGLEMLLPGQCIAVFNDSPAVIAAGAPSMRLMGACGPLIATAMILTQALFGAGNTRFVMIAELSLHFGCLVPLAWILGVWLDLGLFGIWSSGAVYAAGLTIAVVWKFRQGTWKQIRI